MPPFVSHVELAWHVPSNVRLIERLSSFARLLRFDKRGTGMSDRVEGVPTLETRMDDVRAVMDAVGSESAALLGASEGGSMGALFAATYPDRCWALVLFGAIASDRSAPDYPWGESEEELEAALERARAWGTPEYGRAMAADLFPDAPAEEREAFATLTRQAASPGAAVALMRMNREIDVRGVLGAIRVPTLVMYRAEDDPLIVGGSSYIAGHVPGARSVVFPGSEHSIAAGNSPAVLEEMERFLRGEWDERLSLAEEPERVLATILFTDIVGSTRRRSSSETAPGASSSRATTASSGKSSRAIAAASSTRPATGSSPASTARPARSSARAASPRRSRSSASTSGRGLHTGECELIDGKVGGIAVHIGARVARRGPARRGARLLDGQGPRRRLRDRVRGSRNGRAKGVPGDWRLFAVERAP